MDNSKTLVIGLGSMGKRRIRLLRQIGRENIIGVDKSENRRKECEDLFRLNTYESLDEAFKESHVKNAIVCTSPLSHAEIISECLDNNLNVFTEINLVNTLYKENIAKAKQKKLTLFLSSTFLYRSEVNYIRERVAKCGEKLNYIYHVGQYLPDWHPWESIKDYFIGETRSNGCREIFAIELPWLVAVFGEIEELQVLAGKNTKLSIDYQDNYLVLIKHSSGHKGMFAVDVVCRKPIRYFETYGENVYISWDGNPTGLMEFDIEKKREEQINLYETIDTLDGYNTFIVENDYQNELVAFFNAVEKDESPEYTFEDDLKTLEWIDKIEKDI